METVRRAVVDIGTNSIKLLVADVTGPDLRPVIEESKQTRLGQGFYRSRRLQPGPIAATAKAVADFAALAREKNAASIRLIATSAARDALNAADLTGAIEQASGLRVEIITGEEEAELAFRGVVTDPSLAGEPLLILDAGGGSTEFSVGQGGQILFRHSFALGTVRLMEALPHSDPPQASQLAACRQWLRDFLAREVAPGLTPSLAAEKAGTGTLPTLVGTGGTASILGCMEARLRTFDREKLESTRLSRQRMSEYVALLWNQALEQRKKLPGLPANRADVILYGAALYEAVMEQFELPQLRVSTRGLRFAALME